MPFTIYPDAATSGLLGTPLNTPVPLAVGAAMAAFVPLAGFVGPDPDAFDLSTTFIRISMLLPASATPPQVEMRAVNPATLTEGAPVSITATSVGTAQGLSDGTNGTDAAAAYFYPPHANNVYLLKVVIFIAGTTLKMKITNNTGAARDFVWVVADSAANAQQPWIHAIPNALTYTALVNQTSDETAQSIQITNRGTGPLAVSNVSPAIAAPYTISGLPVALDPNPVAPSNVLIGFNAPGTIGDTPLANFTFVSTDPGPSFGAGHNQQFSLSATTSKLEIGMALDDSGSMTWGPGGEDPPIGGPTKSRWSELRSAAKIFLELLGGFGENRGTFGIVKFPGKQGFPINDVTTYDFDPVATAKPIPDANGMTPIENLLDATNPFYQGTPMYYALERLLTAPSPYFATDNDSRDRNRRWILLMSDGAWNSSPDPRGWLPQLVLKKIKVFSAGYGTAGQVDYPTLVALSTGPGSTPGGMSQQVNSGDPNSAIGIANSFKVAIKSGLTSISSALDPTGVIYASKPEARHPVIITPYDTKAAFMINWNTPDAKRLELHLITPAGELITPDDARDGRIPGITFIGGERHQLYIIDRYFLTNEDDPSRPRYGTWHMIVLGRSLREDESREGSEHYAYDTLLESSLRLEATLDRGAYFTGDKIVVTGRPTVKGLPILNAAVRLEVTMPGQGMDDWLASIPISEGEYREAARALAEKDASPIYIKAYAAQLKGFTFNSMTSTMTVPMIDADNTGVYTATFNETKIPDGYKLYVSAVGITTDGVIFQRDKSLETYLSVRPDPDFTLIDIRYDRFKEDHITATVRVTPRDRFGNIILIDPATSRDIRLRVMDAEIDKLTTNFDGTYTTRLTYRIGARPSITLLVAGVAVIRNQIIAPVDQLRYVDEVLGFDEGLEGSPGANRHTNPKDALGDFIRKDPNLFVSLGGYGSLTVGFAGQVILAQGDDDITVFLHPDTDLRSYLVEAMPADNRGSWVALGKSAGVTQSFSLKKADLDAVSAIRITDTSGRTRDANLKPISTPGVSVRGVGAVRTEQSRPVRLKKAEGSITESMQESQLVELLISLLKKR